ncbi:MAG: ABC transporter substrate-binding protein [Paracoccaceae bacterium]|nr:ABC transporter substrate-binding protein [Paracoccaceae bacterium]
MRARFGFGRRAVIQSVERRWVLMGGAALGFGALLPARAVQALDVKSAKVLIGNLVSEINTIINSGTSETAMYREFERVFIRYADVPIIARSALGIAARGASDAQMNAFTLAFQGYISRKYGSRFREFIGGNIEVEDARQIKSFYEVISTAYLRGEAPFEVRWHVSNKSGRDLFFNLIIEGINMVAAERTEIGALLDERGGNIEQLTKDLRSLG